MPRRRNESVPRLLESPEDGQQLLGPVDRHVGRLLQFGRTLAGNDRDANGELQPVEGAKAVEVGRVVTREEGTPRAVRVEQVPNGGPLARVERGEDLQDLPAEASDEARGAGPCGDSFQLRTGSVLIRAIAVVEGRGHAFVLDPRPAEGRKAGR